MSRRSCASLEFRTNDPENPDFLDGSRAVDTKAAQVALSKNRDEALSRVFGTEIQKLQILNPLSSPTNFTLTYFRSLHSTTLCCHDVGTPQYDLGIELHGLQ